MSDADVDEVDAWIEAYKEFDGFFPGWVAAAGRGRAWQARWPIVDAMRIISAEACFECDAAFNEISISIIHRRAPIYRLDIVADTHPEGNPFSARTFVPDLPSTFLGSHVHAWADHRAWALLNGVKDLPFRRPIERPHDLDVALELIGNALNLTVSASQRPITLPPQSGLNLAWKGGRKK